MTYLMFAYFEDMGEYSSLLLPPSPLSSPQQRKGKRKKKGKRTRKINKRKRYLCIHIYIKGKEKEREKEKEKGQEKEQYSDLFKEFLWLIHSYSYVCTACNLRTKNSHT